jgi:hypothetical protein
MREVQDSKRETSGELSGATLKVTDRKSLDDGLSENLKQMSMVVQTKEFFERSKSQMEDVCEGII